MVFHYMDATHLFIQAPVKTALSVRHVGNIPKANFSDASQGPVFCRAASGLLGNPFLNMTSQIFGFLINFLVFFFFYSFLYILGDFPGGSDNKESACNEGDQALIPGSGRSPGEGNSNPLQYSCLENSMDKGEGVLRCDVSI